MPLKWTGPLADPPFWLNPLHEVKAEDEPSHLSPGLFVVRCVEELILLRPSFTLRQIAGIVANSINETGWGRYYRACNLGGWKIRKYDVVDNTQWYRAHGNKSSGDPQTCFYRAFRSFREYFALWLARFVPAPGTVDEAHRYRLCGEQFHAGDPWFDDLIAAGYKGEVTKENPAGSLRSHEQLVEDVLQIYAQHLIGVALDGQWGPKSRRAALVWLEGQGRPASDDWRDVLGLEPKKEAPAPAEAPVSLAGVMEVDHAAATAAATAATAAGSDPDRGATPESGVEGTRAGVVVDRRPGGKRF
jgi:hypothetical protein